MWALALGVIEGVLSNALWSLRGMKERKITIVSPRSNETVHAAERDGESIIFLVRGFLPHLPKSHEIWLLTGDPSTGRVWPQGRYPLSFDKKTREWEGYVTVRGRGATVHAVVAPPTSQDLFRYYRQVAEKTRWEPISHIPAECVNRDTVVVRLP